MTGSVYCGYTRQEVNKKVESLKPFNNIELDYFQKAWGDI